MATFSGKSGTVSLGGAQANVRSWSVDVAGDVATGAHSSSSGWTDAYAGMRGWTGSYQVYQGTAAQSVRAGDTGALSLSDGNKTYAGNINVTEVTYNIDIEGAGLVSATVSFTGDGALSIS